MPRSRRHRALASARLAALALAPAAVMASVSCYPALPGVIEVHTLSSIAIHAEVVTSGNVHVPVQIDGRTRAEIIPGDVVRLSPLLADEHGPRSPEGLDIQWYLCSYDAQRGDCFSYGLHNGEGLPDCPAGAFVGAPLGCRLGSGPSVEFVFAPPYIVEMASTSVPLYVMMIARDPAVERESCESRLAAEEDVLDCAIATRPIDIGPLSAVIDSLHELELTDREIFPEELWEVEPNLNPFVTAFELVDLDSGERRELEPRATATVTPGQRFSLTPVVEARETQRWVSNFDYSIHEEWVVWGWRVSASAEVLAVSVDPYFTAPLELAAPEEPGASFYVFTRVRDTGDGEVGEWLRFEVAS